MITIAHPGRYGDLLWALPTIRHLACLRRDVVRLVLPVDPANTTPMVAIRDLLLKQDYIHVVDIREDWSIEQEAPRRPIAPPPLPGAYTVDFALGYQEWPRDALPFYTARLAGVNPEDVDWRPWIHAAPFDSGRADVVFHWTDRWFELKAGLTQIVLRSAAYTAQWLCAPNSRWTAEELRSLVQPATFSSLARHIAGCRLVVTDNSCVMVLAAAMGTRCVVVEPEAARHHWVFWPGSDVALDSTGLRTGHWTQADNAFGQLIYPVLGGDSRPTFDARHTRDTIERLLR